MTYATGLDPLDERTGPIEPGGLWLLAGPPDAAKLAALLQFLAAGLRGGERCGLVTGSDPSGVLTRSEGWGLGLEEAWRDGRLVVVSFEGDFARRLSHAGRPEDVFEELSQLLGGHVSRIAIDPGGPLWETRADGVMGPRFSRWASGTGATVWATLSGALDERPSSSAEWVLQGARCVLEFGHARDGRRDLTLRRFEGASRGEGPITVELVPGRGLVAPLGEPRRRRTDVPPEAEHNLLLVHLAVGLPADVGAWLASRFQVTEASDPLEAVEMLGNGGAFGTCLLYLDRASVSEAIRVCRTLRPLTPSPLLLVADDALRAEDRARALDAGADDVVSGGIHLGELERRLTGGRRRPAPRSPEGGTPGAAPGGAGPETGTDEGIAGSNEPLEAAAFRRAVSSRLVAGPAPVFTLLRLRRESGDGDLEQAVRRQMRAGSGDLAARLGEGGMVVLLEGARAAQAEAFLDRLRDALPEDAGALEAEVLGSPADAAAIRAWAEG